VSLLRRPPLPILAPSRAAAWPLFRAASSRRIEAQAQAALAPHALMARAGEAVARLGLAVAPHASAAWVLVGPGNNGGDGLEAAIHLQAAGRSVQVHLLADPARLPDDAAWALSRARAAGVPIEYGTLAPAASRDCLAIDALLGLGSGRAPEGILAQAVSALRQHEGPVLAVDLPTGLDGDTGRCLGASPETAVRADHTLSLLTLKPGLFTGQGRDLAGRIWFDDLGTTPGLPPEAWLGLPAGTEPALPRQHAQHKGSFGDVLVVGGAPGMLGAAWLAGRAALAAGAGRVYVQLLDEQADLLDPAHPELMGRRPDDARRLPPESLTVACGCGGGSPVASILPWWLGRAHRLVLDADALNAIASDAGLQTQLQRRALRGQSTLLTPHPLEAARLLGCSSQEIQSDRLAAAQTLAERLGCTVVLKGSGTVVAQAGQPAWINATGNASLATAGTGDVLAGWLAGCWAQGLTPWQAARHAVHRHGAAADRWVAEGRGGPLPASRLIEVMSGGAC
jgi:ADP-dependent NAD(P)H-hydrate dehydratase / NAD(P)H-hydrate epimerase